MGASGGTVMMTVMTSSLAIAVILLFSLTEHLAKATPLDPVPLPSFSSKDGSNTDRNALNTFIRHYHVARYDRKDLEQQHRRKKRATFLKTNETIAPLRFNIQTNDRVFRLRLHPNSNSVFSNNVEFDSTNGPLTSFDPATVYTGTLDDDERANVYGLITSEGLFDGTISTVLDDYYVEPVSRYHQNETHKNVHSIIYRLSDVIYPNINTTLCPSQLLHQRRRSQSPTAAARRWVYDRNQPQEKQSTVSLNIEKNNDLNLLINRGDVLNDDLWRNEHSLFDILPNERSLNNSDFMFRFMSKRATIDPKKTTCMLYLQADHHFFQKYGTEEACIEVMTRHVQRVNAIYRVTDFNQDGKPDNITFMIKRIKVHSTEALNDPLYRFPGTYGVEKFLELFSEEDYDAFCLAYMFTYRDFEMGTLGLAWTGDLKNAGGVCERNGHYRGSMKSLNTGIVTLLNYGKHVPPAVSHVTLAHEIGHNFGSPHDPELCTPGGEDGNYIMFARATSGDKKNNNKFSPCSLKSINPVLNYKARSMKGCFTEPKTSLCGNGVVEEGEECDCGWEEDCHDKCCHPQRRHPPIDEPPCHLVADSICSPSQGPCCTSECQLKFGDKCRDDNGCRDASFCNGRQPQCPPSINKPDKTICNKEFVCYMGECTGSICLAYGLESCQCIPKANESKTKACELCCKLPGDNKLCLSSFEWNEKPYDVPDMYSKPGTPCNDYNGYCDVFQKCRDVDPSGPLATLRKLLLSEESIASFKKLLSDYWYAALLVVGLMFSILTLGIKFLGKRPMLKLKSVTIMHSSTTETVRLPSDGEAGAAVTVHPAIRSKLPLKQKVRNGRKRRNNEKRSPTKVRNLPTTAPTTDNNASAEKKPSIFAKNKRFLSNKKTTPKQRIIRGSAVQIDSSAKKMKTSSSPSKKKKKKIIDYSVGNQESSHHNVILSNNNNNINSNNLTVPGTTTASSSPNGNPNDVDEVLGKVQNWLLQSHMPTAAMPKSKSTPVGLVETANNRPVQPIKLHTSNNKSQQPSNTEKCKSVGHLPNQGDKEKIRLQVIYKPPFKFSLRLRKAEKSSVVVDRSGQRVADRGAKIPRNNGKTTTTARRAGLVVRKVVKSNQRNDQRHPNVRQTSVEKQTAKASSSSSKNKQQINSTSPTGMAMTSSNEMAASVPPLPLHSSSPREHGIDSNIHTVQSDLEVLLSDSEFLFANE